MSKGRTRAKGGRPRRALHTLLIAIPVIVLAGVWALGAFRSSDPVEAPRVAALAERSPGSAAVRAHRETLPTMDPALFNGKARLAYQVAREIPGALDQLRCYCACDREYGHVSLLSCYTDGHGST